MEKAKPKRKKRKRTVPKGKAKPTPATHTVDTVDVGEMIEKIYLYISSIEMQVSAIKRTLLEYSSEC